MMSKRLRISVIATVLVAAVGGFVVGQAAGQGGQKVEDVFEDITSGNSHLAGIQFVYDNDLMLGRAVGEWHPKQAVTREQLATILHRYAEWDDRRSNPYSGQPSPTLPGTRPEPPQTASTQPGGSIPQTTTTTQHTGVSAPSQQYHISVTEGWDAYGEKAGEWVQWRITATTAQHNGWPLEETVEIRFCDHTQTDCHSPMLIPISSAEPDARRVGAFTGGVGFEGRCPNPDVRYYGRTAWWCQVGAYEVMGYAQSPGVHVEGGVLNLVANPRVCALCTFTGNYLRWED